MNTQTKQPTHQELDEKLKKTAEILGFTLEPRKPDDTFSACYRVSINGPDKISLWLTAFGYQERDRITIHGTYPRDAKDQYIRPYDYGEKQMDKITVSLTKSAEQIARDIKARFMPEYLRRLEKVKKQIADSNDYHGGRQAAIKEVAAGLGLGIDTHREDGAIHFYDDGFSFDVEPHGRGKVKLTIQELTPAQCIAIGKTLERLK